MNRLSKAIVCGFFVLIVSMAAVPMAGAASDSEITYQGQLTLEGEKVNQPCDFCFSLWNASDGGVRQGSELCKPALSVEDGVFTTTLDFGAQNLQIDLLWLQITADCNGAPPPGPLLLTPRQQITAAPFALHTKGIAIDDNGNASVDGIIESTRGGFKFPDDTTMASKNDVVTGVTAGAGLTVDHPRGDVTLSASFGGNGSATTASHSDHYHNKLAASDGDPNDALLVGAAGNVTIAASVGIGRTSPQAKLDIDSGTASAPPGIRITQWDNHLLLNCTAPAGQTTPTSAGSITVNGLNQNGAQEPAGAMHFQVRSATGTYQKILMSLFFSNKRMEYYGEAWKSSSTWTVFSDRRLKKNIQSLDKPLERLLGLHGVSFEYLDSNSPLLPPGIHTGFVAQEVEKVFPEWISENSEGYKAVTVNGFEALTVESLRQLRNEKDAEIATLRNRIERLEQLLGATASGKGGE